MDCCQDKLKTKLLVNLLKMLTVKNRVYVGNHNKLINKMLVIVCCVLRQTDQNNDHRTNGME